MTVVCSVPLSQDRPGMGVLPYFHAIGAIDDVRIKELIAQIVSDVGRKAIRVIRPVLFPELRDVTPFVIFLEELPSL